MSARRPKRIRGWTRYDGEWWSPDHRKVARRRAGHCLARPWQVFTVSSRGERRCGKPGLLDDVIRGAS